MKLKKLLPLAGITGVAAIVAPLVTSCANKGTAIKWEEGDDVELIAAKHGAGEGTEFADEDKMLEAYLSDVEGDKTIMSKDLITSALYECARISDENPGIDGETKIEVRSISARTDSVDVEKHLASIHVEAEYKITNPLVYSKPYTVNIDWTIKNIEYMLIEGVDETTEEPYFGIQPKWLVLFENRVLDPTSWFEYAIELSKDTKWSFEVSQTSSLGTTMKFNVNHSNVYEIQYDDNWDWLIDSWFMGTNMSTTYFENETLTA